MVRGHADLDGARELARGVVGERALLRIDVERVDHVLEHPAIGLGVADACAVEQVVEMLGDPECLRTRPRHVSCRS